MGAMNRTDEGTAVWSAFLHAHAALVDVLEARLQERRGLPLAWYDVLKTLARAPGATMRMQDLARGVLLSKSGLTRLFDRMEQAGIVERQSCPSDRRGTLAVMTPKGRRTLRAATPVAEAAVEEYFLAHLTRDEARAMQSAFDKILSAQGRVAASCDSADEGELEAVAATG
jgi:DNA-binding MarR family transcriptional regulator